MAKLSGILGFYYICDVNSGSLEWSLGTGYCQDPAPDDEMAVCDIRFVVKQFTGNSYDMHIRNVVYLDGANYWETFVDIRKNGAVYEARCRMVHAISGTTNGSWTTITLGDQYYMRVMYWADSTTGLQKVYVRCYSDMDGTYVDNISDNYNSGNPVADLNYFSARVRWLRYSMTHGNVYKGEIGPMVCRSFDGGVIPPWDAGMTLDNTGGFEYGNDLENENYSKLGSMSSDDMRALDVLEYAAAAEQAHSSDETLSGTTIGTEIQSSLTTIAGKLSTTLTGGSLEFSGILSPLNKLWDGFDALVDALLSQIVKAMKKMVTSVAFLADGFHDAIKAVGVARSGNLITWLGSYVFTSAMGFVDTINDILSDLADVAGDITTLLTSIGGDLVGAVADIASDITQLVTDIISDVSSLADRFITYLKSEIETNLHTIISWFLSLFQNITVHDTLISSFTSALTWFIARCKTQGIGAIDDIMTSILDYLFNQIIKKVVFEL